jgi:GH35 family endo-1,4-beta-xylanase
VNFTQLDKEIIGLLDSAGLVDDKFALGIQGHLRDNIPTDIADTLRSYGVKTIVTECDIDMRNAPGSQEQRDHLQAEQLNNFLEAVEASGTCDDYAFWGIGDKYSWLERDTNPDANANADPTLFDDDLNPKASFEALRVFLTNVVQRRGA